MTDKLREELACYICQHESNCDSYPTLGIQPKHPMCKKQLALVDKFLNHPRLKPLLEPPKGRLLTEKEMQLLGQQYEDDLPTCDLNHYLLKAQDAKTVRYLTPDIEGLKLLLRTTEFHDIEADLSDVGTWYLSEVAVHKILSLITPLLNKQAEDEAEAIVNCVKDAKRVHPDWTIDEVIKLLTFRNETRQALRDKYLKEKK